MSLSKSKGQSLCQTSESPSFLLSKIASEIQAYKFKNFDFYQYIGESTISFPNISFEQVERDVVFARQMLSRLDAIQEDALSYQEQLTKKILTWDIKLQTKALKLYWLQFPVTSYHSQFMLAQEIFASFEFQEPADLDIYLELLADYPAYIEGIREKLVRQRERGILVPRDALDLIVHYLRSHIREGTQSNCAVAEERIEALKAHNLDRFHTRVERIINHQINPALEELVGVFDSTYWGKAPKKMGISQYAGGLEAYQILIEQYTTWPLRPQEIHEMGHAAVESVDVRMSEVRQLIGFKGSKTDFHNKLKNEPRFFVDTPEELEERLLSYVRKAEPTFDLFFHRIPAAPYGVRRLNSRLENTMTFGSYESFRAPRPVGHYRYNASALDTQSWLWAGTLIYHELVPGHHFQIGLQRENTDLPAVRRAVLHAGFMEGWGEYAAGLADEMGLYDDPYDRYGWLSFDMLHAVRMVVDTGMNALGWSKQKAVDYMKDHLLQSDKQIDSEVIRYTVDMPAQSLTYKVAGIQFWELRRRVELALRERFDIKKFHDAVLDFGSMPLEILEWHLESLLRRGEL
ncbi:MAG: DUF885 domain-containing protein [Anaerolineales bacterium]|nr:DUF885 domain-containing protein [Anaerolineales bacterium]